MTSDGEQANGPRMDDQRTNREGGRLNRIGIIVIDGIEVLVPVVAAFFLAYYRIFLPSLLVLGLAALMAFKLWDDLRIEKERRK